MLTLSECNYVSHYEKYKIKGKRSKVRKRQRSKEALIIYNFGGSNTKLVTKANDLQINLDEL